MNSKQTKNNKTQATKTKFYELRQAKNDKNTSNQQDKIS